MSIQLYDCCKKKDDEGGKFGHGVENGGPLQLGPWARLQLLLHTHDSAEI